MVEITVSGEALKEKVASVPEALTGCINLEPHEAVQLYTLLYKVLGR